MTVVLDDEEVAEAPTVADRPSRRWPVLLTASAVLFAGLAGWFTVEADHARGGAAADNSALVDTPATAAVLNQVDDGLGKIFSYKFDSPAATEQAANQVLAGAAKDQYNQLFAEVRQLAPAQKLTLVSKVVTAGVTYLDADHATLLVFLDQDATRADTGDSSTGAAQLTVTATRTGPTWHITALQAR